MQIPLLKYSKQYLYSEQKQSRVPDGTLFFAASETFHSSSPGGASRLLFFSCAPLPRIFLLSLPPGGAPRLLFFSCAPLPRIFLLSLPPSGAPRLLFFSCAPLPLVFLLSLSYDQNPVTSLDLISGHTIGLPEGCHRHIIPLSDIPQTVTLPHYINSQ